MIQLSPADIAAVFSLVQIDARITNLVAAIDAAELSAVDSFDDMQAKQRVQRQTLSELYSALSVWIKARRIITGDEAAEIQLLPASYLPWLENV
jgi:hypothetical protein